MGLMEAEGIGSSTFLKGGVRGLALCVGLVFIRLRAKIATSTIVFDALMNGALPNTGFPDGGEDDGRRQGTSERGVGERGGLRYLVPDPVVVTSAVSEAGTPAT